jgi:hypothetical protein
LLPLHVLGDKLHAVLDALHDMRDLIGKRGGKVAGLRSGMSERRIVFGRDRGNGDPPHRRKDHDAGDDDPQNAQAGASDRIAAQDCGHATPSTLNIQLAREWLIICLKSAACGSLYLAGSAAGSDQSSTMVQDIEK